VVTLAEQLDESAVLAASARRGLALEGLADYHHGASARPPALVIDYATPPDHAYSGARSTTIAGTKCRG
jgi:GntR family transcriptional regulator/MocR family aminotransferase